MKLSITFFNSLKKVKNETNQPLCTLLYVQTRAHTHIHTRTHAHARTHARTQIEIMKKSSFHTEDEESNLNYLDEKHNMLVFEASTRKPQNAMIVIPIPVKINFVSSREGRWFWGRRLREDNFKRNFLH